MVKVSGGMLCHQAMLLYTEMFVNINASRNLSERQCIIFCALQSGAVELPWPKAHTILGYGDCMARGAQNCGGTCQAPVCVKDQVVHITPQRSRRKIALYENSFSSGTNSDGKKRICTMAVFFRRQLAAWRYPSQYCSTQLQIRVLY